MADASQQMADRPGNRVISEEARRQAALDQAKLTRKKQALQLQRENILSQRTSSPVRRAALEAALAHVEAQLAELA
ncbi:MAG TPA: hypothetical protein VMV57_09310 [Terracidiphilus sp.]|nr:hypothetical protein [Terracidiphilus sp.]